MSEYTSSSSFVKPRHIHSVNWTGMMTLVQKEVGRFMNVYSQTIVAPVVTTLLFYVVFALAFGGQDRTMGDVPFLTFLAPGLVMMTMAQNSFANTSSSFIIAKVQGNIVDVLLPPLSSFEIFIGFVVGGLLRGLCIGALGVVALAVFTDLQISSYFVVILFAVLGNLMMGSLGVIAGLWADRFDHIAAFTNFVITPLTFLSGTFYSIEILPPMWKKMAEFNPFFYMIDGFRSGFTGNSDGHMVFGALFLSVVTMLIMAATYVIIRSGYKIKS